MPQSQPTEIKQNSGLLGRDSLRGGCVDFFRETIGPRCPRRVWVETPGCGASQIAKPGPGGPSGVRPSPRPQPRQPRALGSWLGGRGRRIRLPAALFPAGRGAPSGQPGTETADHRPCPPTSPPSAEASRGLGGSPRAGPPAPPRAVLPGVRPPQPGLSGRQAGGRPGRGGRRGRAEPLPRGRAAQAQTLPYVVAPRARAAPGGCRGRPDTPRVSAALGISASSGGLDREERPPALFFFPLEHVPRSPRRKWSLPLGRTLSLPSFPCVCGKVSLRAEVQAETSGLGAGGVDCLPPGAGTTLAPPRSVRTMPTMQHPPLPWELYLAVGG